MMENDGEKTIKLTQPHGGQPLTIIVGANNVRTKLKETLLSLEDFRKLQANFNISQKTTCGIASTLRVATKNFKIIEPNLKTKLQSANHAVDEYFTNKVFEFVSSKADKVTQSPVTVAYCHDLDGFIKHVQNERQISEFKLKFGIDGGGSFLKVCLSILPTGEKSYQHDEGPSAKKFKSSGVKKLFVLALAQCTQENYENVRQLWSALRIEEFAGTIATDLKLANIMVGIMSHSSTNPCTWCDAHKDKLNERGEFRTIGRVLQNYMDWQEAGAQKQKAKNYKCCIKPPVISSNTDQSILEIIPPPELHLMIGIVNTLYNHMQREFENVALEWAKACHVQRQITYGSSGFNGNSCKILLEKVDVLRQKCSLSWLKFVKVFEDFKSVVTACFGNDLHSNYKEKIATFRRSYIDLNVSITPKVHAVLFHIEDFCELNQTGLGFYSEQAMEAVHFDFNSMWQRYKVPCENPEYCTMLQRALCAYNSLHM